MECGQMLTPYAPCPSEQRNGCSYVNDANEARNEGRYIERRYTVSENTEALEERSVWKKRASAPHAKNGLIDAILTLCLPGANKQWSVSRVIVQQINAPLLELLPLEHPTNK
jgi:hypothetical protein